MSRRTRKSAPIKGSAIRSAPLERRQPLHAAHTRPRPSTASRAVVEPRPAIQATTFAALADPTRLSLLSRLSRNQPSSISQLTHGSHLTRQAITKHLRVLERAKIVRSVRSGRHALFELDPQPVLELRDYLDRISAQWDDALSRLKSFVEDAH